jgi:hypothetical protein
MEKHLSIDQTKQTPGDKQQAGASKDRTSNNPNRGPAHFEEHAGYNMVDRHGCSTYAPQTKQQSTPAGSEAAEHRSGKHISEHNRQQHRNKQQRLS